MRKSRICLVLAMVIAFCLAPFMNTVYAASSYILGIVQGREGGYAYQISGKDVWKIVAYGESGYNYDNAIYCIKAGPGFGGTITSPTETREYNVSYNMKELEKIPENYLNNVLPSDEIITEEIDGQEVSYSKYNAVLWILDNMYLPKHKIETERKAMRDALLTAAFKEQIEDTTTTPPFTIEKINLTDDDIEVVQQLAIWHFTNMDETQYDQGDSLAAIQIKATESSDAYDAFEQNSYRQEDANTLYQYFIKEAPKNASIYGTGDIRKLPAPVQFKNTTLKTEAVGNTIYVGPFNIQKQSELGFNITANVYGNNDTEITAGNYKIVYVNEQNQKVDLEEGKTLKDIVGKDFYIVVGKDVDTVNLKLTLSYNEAETIFWNVSGSDEEQPVVIVNKTTTTIPLMKGLKYNFDLALQKYLTEVNGKKLDKEESRESKVVVSSTGDVTIVPINQPPVKVESGDIVTYTIRIYNQGKVNGYAQQVKDDIPAGLEFLPDNSVNKKYGWTMTKDANGKDIIVTNYLGKDDNKTHLLKAFDYTTMDTTDYEDIEVVFKVTEPNSSKNTIINTAEISEDLDENGNAIDDRDSTPNNGEAGSLEDDIDKEYLILKEFDLALRKFITQVNDTKVTNRVPEIVFDTTNPEKDPNYDHPKNPISVENGDIVVYTIRIYNEGETDGYANLVQDNIPEGLEFLIDHSINQEYRWKLSADLKTIATDYLSCERDEDNILDARKGNDIDYKDVKVAFKVTEPNTSTRIIENIAEIADDADKNNKPTEDDDSTPANGIEDGKHEDDIDTEYIRLKYFDLALKKFVTAVNDEKLAKDKLREPVAKLDSNGNPIYEFPNNPLPTKNPPVPVATGDLVTYTIRIYNEGSLDGYASKVIDDVPSGLEFVPENEINKKYGWTISSNGKQVSTNYLSKDKSTDNLIEAFDNKVMDTPKYKDIQVVFKVTEPNTSSRILINTAEIADDTDKNGNPVEDWDSYPANGTDGEDDIDFDKVKVVRFDLALSKFITAVDSKEITTRVPTATIDPTTGAITYPHPEEPLLVANGNLVTYTIRIYNEGTVDGYAEIIKDDVPTGLQFIADNETNKAYGWVLSEDGKSITTDYLSSAKSADNIIKAFLRDSMQTPDYKDVKVVFKVTEEQIPADRILINTAEINKDKNEFGINDDDSKPGNWIGEDDLDTEKVKVQYFDLALLKWVSTVIVTEDGNTTVRETGHTGLENPEPIVKVEIDRKKLKKTSVKFEYTIKVINEGQIAGYAKEVSDYIPEGLEYVQEDNPLWTSADGKVVTKQLENTLLQPGESATVTILLRWINNESNMELKVNTAEISEDYNDYGSKDIDSKPNNKTDGEDDIDTAPVILTLKTGQARIYYVLMGTILVTIAAGIMLIKKFVL